MILLCVIPGLFV